MEFLLGAGSLLLMEGDTQEHWQHRVPKRTAAELKAEARSKTCSRVLDAPTPRSCSSPTFKEKKELSKGCSRRPDASDGSIRTFKGTTQSKFFVRPVPFSGKGGSEKTLEGGASGSSSTEVRDVLDGGRSGLGEGARRGGRGSKEVHGCRDWPTAGRVNLTFRRVENDSSKG